MNKTLRDAINSILDKYKYELNYIREDIARNIAAGSYEKLTELSAKESMYQSIVDDIEYALKY